MRTKEGSSATEVVVDKVAGSYGRWPHSSIFLVDPLTYRSWSSWCPYNQKALLAFVSKVAKVFTCEGRQLGPNHQKHGKKKPQSLHPRRSLHVCTIHRGHLVVILPRIGLIRIGRLSRALLHHRDVRIAGRAVPFGAQDHVIEGAQLANILLVCLPVSR